MKQRRNLKEEVFDDLLWIPEYLVRQTKLEPDEKEELRQELIITLWLSLNQYLRKRVKNELRRGSSLQMYVHKSCFNRRISFLRKFMTNKYKSTVRLSDVDDIGVRQQTVNVVLRYNQVSVDGKDILKHEPDILKRKVFYDFLCGYSQKEISKKYDIPVHTVKNWVHKVRERLRRV